MLAAGVQETTVRTIMKEAQLAELLQRSKGIGKPILLFIWESVIILTNKHGCETTKKIRI